MTNNLFRIKTYLIDSLRLTFLAILALLWPVYVGLLYWFQESKIDWRLQIRQLFHLAVNLLYVVPETLLMVLILVISLGMGRTILRWLNCYSDNGKHTLLFSLGVGLGILQLCIYLLGLAGQLNTPLLVSLLFSMTILGLPGWIVLLNELRKHRLPSEPLSAWEWIIILMVSGQMILNFKNVLLPPLEADSLALYLTYPKTFARQHLISFLPLDQVITYSPLGGLMLYTLAFALSGETLVLLFQFAFGLLTLSVLFAMGQEWHGRLAGFLAAAIFYFTPLTIFQANSGKIDLQWCFFELLSIYALLKAFQTQTPASFCLSGILLGTAISIRPYSLISMVLFGLLWLGVAVLQYRSGSPLKKLFLQAVALALPVSLIGGHWFIRNWILTGDPLIVLKWAGDYSSRFTTYSEFFRLLWELSFHGLHTASAYAEGYGPVLVTFIPLVIFIPHLRQKPFVYIWIFIILYIWIWLHYLQTTRFMAQVVALAGLLIAVGIMEIGKIRRWLLPISLIFLTAQLILSALVTDPLFTIGWGVILGKTGREEYLRANLDNLLYTPGYEMTQYINRELPKTATIVLIGAYHPYYLERDAVRLPFDVVADPGRFTKAMAEIRDPYILISTRYPVYWPHLVSFMDTLFSASFQRSHLRFMHRGSNQTLFQYDPNSETFMDDGSGGMVFSAGDLPTQYEGGLEQSNTGDTMRCVTPNQRLGDGIVFGPGTPLPDGYYEANIFLKVADNSVGGEVAYLDIFADNNVLTAMFVKATDFKQPDQFQRFMFRFTVPKASEYLYARVFYRGLTKVCVQGIRFLKINKFPE